jgi:glycosyltransferase involved in cell wall biosynthesis
MLEAMALGVPLVATSICCEGLRVVPGEHLLVAEDASGFASAVEFLLNNVALRQSIIESARAYVERHHDWSDSVSALLNSYAEAIAHPAAQASADLGCTGTRPDVHALEEDAA